MPSHISHICSVVSAMVLYVVACPANIAKPATEFNISTPSRLVKCCMTLTLNGMEVEALLFQPTSQGEQHEAAVPRSFARHGPNPVLQPTIEVIDLPSINTNILHKIARDFKLILPAGELQWRHTLTVTWVRVNTDGFDQESDDLDLTIPRCPV